MHGSIGPSCAVADFRADGLTVWTGSQNPHRLLKDLALLTGLAPERIEVIRHEAAGCYGRNCADDVAADAVLLSKAVGAPVRVQLTREQEHLWEPKGAAQLIEIKGGLGAGATLKAYDFHTWYPSNDAPTLALLLTGRLPNKPSALKMGDRTAVPAYDYENMRLTAYDMAPIVRASWLRGVSAMPNVFAHESYIDELADEAGVDPVAFRLAHIDDERAARPRARHRRARRLDAAHDAAREGDILRGRGFAQARYVHGNWPGVGAAWAAWVADVAVNRATGEVTVSRVVVGQDTGMMVNPAGVTHQIHGNVLQSTSRVLREEVTFSETTAVASRDWGGYPVLTFPGTARDRRAAGRPAKRAAAGRRQIRLRAERGGHRQRRVRRDRRAFPRDAADAGARAGGACAARRWRSRRSARRPSRVMARARRGGRRRR